LPVAAAGCRIEPHPEERQLEAVPLAVVGGQVAGVVPPLRPVLVVRAVIARKGELEPGSAGWNAARKQTNETNNTFI